MPSPLLFAVWAWVKNVYRLRKGGRANRGRSYTFSSFVGSSAQAGVHKSAVLHQRVPMLSDLLSPMNFAKLPLLSATYAHNPQPLLLRERRKDMKGITTWS